MKPIPSKIISIKDEGTNRKTITVLNKQIAERATPGQFIMVWIPGIDEIPMGLSYIGEEEISFTVHKVGEATSTLHKMKVNDHIGVRGPYGRGFEEKTGKLLIVGGGTGMAPLMPLIRKLVQRKDNEITVINGAKTAFEMIFRDELENMAKNGNIRYIPTTEDGSLGERGLATTIMEKFLENEKLDEIYVCGPEQMIKVAMEISLKNGIHMQASIERYMKCAIGICGSCTVDPIGLRVCVEGPVIPLEKLVEIKELGIYKRDSSGTKRNI
ncbi:MAG: dihydroorotate dehydrogenase electron transfer subunit [Candidatus Methanomethylicia archaeon]